VRQIGHLPELYEDARSEKYKILYHSVSLYKLRDIVLNSEMTAFLKSPISWVSWNYLALWGYREPLTL